MHVRRYHKYTGDVQCIRVFNINHRLLSIYSPWIMISPYVLMVAFLCAEYTPIYSWYPPNESWYSSDVLNILRCTKHTLYWVIILKIVYLLCKWWLLLVSFFIQPLFLEVYCAYRSFSHFFSVLNNDNQLTWLHCMSKATENLVPGVKLRVFLGLLDMKLAKFQTDQSLIRLGTFKKRNVSLKLW